MARAHETAAIVVGGGVIGAAAAWSLGRRGVPTVLLERFAPGHDRGSSHGDGRIFRHSYAEPVYAEMAARSHAGWQALERAAGERLLVVSGGLDLGPADSPVLADLEATFRDRGLPWERFDAGALGRRFPQLALAAGSEALYQPDGGVIRADRAVRALWRAAAAAGVECLAGARAVGLERAARGDGGGVEVRCEDGRRVVGDGAILAAGPWTAGLLAAAGLEPALPLRVSQERLIYFPVAAGAPGHGARSGFAGGVAAGLPTVIDYHDPETPFYALPRLEVPGVKTGWHRTGPTVDPDAPRRDTPELRAALEAWIGERFPYLRPAPVADLSCLYTNTPDHDFVVDRHPAWPRLVVGAGFSGHGFKFAPVIGDMLAACWLDDADPVPRAAFRIDRFAPTPARSR